MADTINKIVGQQAFDEVEKLKDGVEGLYKSFENLTTMIKGVESSLGSAKGLKDIITAYKRTIDLNKEQTRIVDAHNKVMDKFSQQQERLAKQAEALEKQEKAREERRLRQSEKLIKAKDKELELMKKTAQESIALAKKINEEEERRLKAQERAIQNRIDATKRYNQYDANRGNAGNSNNISAQIDSQILQNRKEANDFSLLLQQSLIKEQEQIKKSNLAWKQYFSQYSQGIKEAEESGKDFAKALKARLEEEEKLAQQQEKTRQQEAKAMSGSTNIYEYNRKRLQELTTQLRSLEIQYQMSARGGKANADELKRQRDAIAPLEKEYKELAAILDEVEGRTGGSTRSRNQMLVETNQLLREMPNFAISAQTGILSLSNNLPMFFEAWQRTSKEIDTATNKAKGFKGAMSAFVSSLFSVQTALIVLVTLMVQYGEEITDFLMKTSDSEKAQRDFNKSLEDSIKTYSKQIGSLMLLKQTINDTNSTLKEHQKVLKEVDDEFKNAFSGIDASNLEKQNELIDKQIKFLREKIRMEAAMKTLDSASATLLEKEAKALDTNVGLWENLWEKTRLVVSEFNTMSSIRFAENLQQGVSRLTNENLKSYQSLKKMNEEGKITDSVFRVLTRRLIDAEDAAKSFGAVTKLVSDELGKLNPKDYTASISSLEIALLNAETAQKGFIKDSEGWNSAAKNVSALRKQVQLTALTTEFAKKGFEDLSVLMNPESADYNTQIGAEYRARRKAILAEDVNEFRKAGKEKKDTVWDIDKAILEVRKKLADIKNDIKSSMLDEASVGFMDIVENENKALDERLKNLDLYYKNEKEKILFEQQKELAIIEEGEKRKKALEDKLGRTISSEKDLQSLVREKKLNDEQKNFLAMTLTYNKQREKINREANARLVELEKGRSDDVSDVIKSDYDKRVNDYQSGLQAVTEAIRSGTNAQILELNKKRKEVGMTETQYYRELESIIKGEGAKVITAQLDFIEKYKQDLEILSNSKEYENMSVEAKNSINNMLQFLTNAYADATRRVEKDASKYKSIGELIRGWFGKNDKGDFKLTQKQVDDMISGVVNSFQSMFDSLNQMWANYYEKRQQEVDEEERRFDKYYNNEKYRIESSLDSQEEKERMLKELDGQRLASEQEVDRKRREISRQQAQREKQQAMFQATTKTALGIINIWSEYAGAPIVAAVLTAALMGALAAQMAAIQSAPIPAYEKGTPKQGHKGGMALVGEKRRELVITPDGQMFYTPSSPTLMNLPQGTHVLPNPDAMSNQAKMEAVSRLSKTRRNSGGFDVYLLSAKLDNLTSVVRNKQENYFDLKNGEIRKMVKKNNARINYIGRC